LYVLFRRRPAETEKRDRYALFFLLLENILRGFSLWRAAPEHLLKL
jgi:hypothetical protein